MNRRDFLKATSALAIMPTVPAAVPKLGDKLILPSGMVLMMRNAAEATAVRMGLVRELIELGALRKA